MDYNNLTPIEKRHWVLAYCDEIECAMCHDGLTFKFDYEDIKDLLAHYPRDREGWYFNESKDRLMAERDFDRVIVNPSFVYKHFTEIVT